MEAGALADFFAKAKADRKIRFMAALSEAIYRAIHGPAEVLIVPCNLHVAPGAPNSSRGILPVFRQSGDFTVAV